MNYDLNLADRIRGALAEIPGVEEQEKMGGVSFMVAGAMCVRAHPGGDMMLRCEPGRTDELLARKGARRFEMKNKPMMKGWLLVGPEGLSNKADFDFWMGIALEAANKAKAAPKKPVM